MLSPVPNTSSYPYSNSTLRIVQSTVQTSAKCIFSDHMGKLLDTILRIWAMRNHTSLTRQKARRTTTLSHSTTLLFEVERGTKRPIKKGQAPFQFILFSIFWLRYGVIFVLISFNI
jgi:hypothetical protein